MTTFIFECEFKRLFERTSLKQIKKKYHKHLYADWKLITLPAFCWIGLNTPVSPIAFNMNIWISLTLQCHLQSSFNVCFAQSRPRNKEEFFKNEQEWIPRMRRYPSGVSKEHLLSNVIRNSIGNINCYHSQTLEKSIIGLHETQNL